MPVFLITYTEKKNVNPGGDPNPINPNIKLDLSGRPKPKVNAAQQMKAIKKSYKERKKDKKEEKKEKQEQKTIGGAFGQIAKEERKGTFALYT